MMEQITYRFVPASSEKSNPGYLILTALLLGPFNLCQIPELKVNFTFCVNLLGSDRFANFPDYRHFRDPNPIPISKRNDKLNVV